MHQQRIADDDAEAVLEYLEERGTFDELRQELMTRLRDNEALQAKTFNLILESKHLPQPTEDRRALQAASEAIRRELTSKVRELMVAAVWEELSKEDGQLARDIQHETHGALCKVHEQRELQSLRHAQTAQPSQGPT